MHRVTAIPNVQAHEPHGVALKAMPSEEQAQTIKAMTAMGKAMLAAICKLRLSSYQPRCKVSLIMRRYPSRCGGELAGPRQFATAHSNFRSASECSIATSLPNGASPPGRDPGAQTVAGRETKPKQNSHVRHHRIFPLATPKPLAIEVPRQRTVLLSST
jgi:hypothetical protein